LRVYKELASVLKSYSFSFSFFKPFELKVFFKLNEKQPVVLSKQPILLLLGVLRKVENYFWWLTCCQTKTTD